MFLSLPPSLSPHSLLIRYPSEGREQSRPRGFSRKVLNCLSDYNITSILFYYKFRTCCSTISFSWNRILFFLQYFLFSRFTLSILTNYLAYCYHEIISKININRILILIYKYKNSSIKFDHDKG